VDPLIRGSHSTTPHAVAIRLHRLHAPEDFKASDVRAKKLRRKAIGVKKTNAIHDRTKLSLAAASKANASSYLATRVRHHLSRGRDATDIAIRENILVSVALELVKLVKGDAK
jgi:hypothetical protein